MNMKKIFVITAAVAAAFSFASCKKVTVSSKDVTGTLSFAEFSLSCDDEVETKSPPETSPSPRPTPQ